MLKGLMGKLVGGVLATSLVATGLISGYQHKKKVDYNQLFEATRKYAEDNYRAQITPTNVNKLSSLTSEVFLERLMKKQDVKNLGIEHRWHKVLYFDYEENGLKHFYAGKIDHVDQIGKTTVYTTRLKDNNFEGFSIPSINGKGQEVISLRQEGKVGGAINIDIYSLRRHAELRKHTYKGGPLPKYTFEATLIHELTHTEEEGDETDAFGVSLEYCNKHGGCPFLEKDLNYLASMKDPKGSEKGYHEAAVKVLNKYKKVKSVPEYAEKLQRIEKKIKEGKRLY